MPRLVPFLSCWPLLICLAAPYPLDAMYSKWLDPQRHPGSDSPNCTASEPPNRSVKVSPGVVFFPKENPVIIKTTTILHFDSPEIRTFEAHLNDGRLPSTPENLQGFHHNFDPWPSGPSSNRNLIHLTPPVNEVGTPILGSYFRAWRTSTLLVEKADGSRAVQGIDFYFNEDWGLIANRESRLGKPGEGTIRAQIEAALPRIDLIQVAHDGSLSVKKGTSSLGCPEPPKADPGCLSLATVWITPWTLRNDPFGRPKRTENSGLDGYAITNDHIFHIRPEVLPEPVNPSALSKAARKLGFGDELRIVFAGDSIMLGAEATAWFDPQRAYTAQDRTWRGQWIWHLRNAFPQSIITPIHSFKGGGNSVGGLTKLTSLLEKETADIVVIAYGANDVYGPIDGPPKNSPETYKSTIREMIQLSRQKGAEVLLVETFPLSPLRRGGGADRIPVYNAILRELAQQEQVALAPVERMFDNLARQGFPPLSQIHNHLNHPGDRGHELYFRCIKDTFAAALEKP